MLILLSVLFDKVVNGNISNFLSNWDVIFIAYLFTRTKKKDEEEVPGVSPTPGPSTAAAAVTATVPGSEKALSPPPIIEHVMLRDPLPENQQRELFKWLLEEKRKVKPKDSEEKKRIDEEKAILKQFIRAKSIPSL